MQPVRLGTRGSALARVQADTVAAAISAHGRQVEIVVIRTSGDDKRDDAPFEGKGLFVKELEAALLDGTIDIAVHSSKDMPAMLADGLAVAAVLPRAEPRDALVLRAGQHTGRSTEEVLAALGGSPAIATSSPRRVAQLARLLPSARFVSIRGNVDTRLRRLDGGEVEALVLAGAGLHRLGLERRITTLLPPELCLPSAGQGIIAIEARAGDRAAFDAVAPLDDPLTMSCLLAERAVVSRLGAGCQMPVAAFATNASGTLTLRTLVIAPDGSQSAWAEVTGPSTAAAALGAEAGDQLLARGAAAILAAMRAADAPRIHHP
jgi:hydroxymethylbilane synthase